MKLKPGASQVIRRGQDAGVHNRYRAFDPRPAPEWISGSTTEDEQYPPAQTRRLGVDQRAKAADLAKQVQSIMIG
jgi:hypothetical protein